MLTQHCPQCQRHHPIAVNVCDCGHVFSELPPRPAADPVPAGVRWLLRFLAIVLAIAVGLFLGERVLPALMGYKNHAWIEAVDLIAILVLSAAGIVVVQRSSVARRFASLYQQRDADRALVAALVARPVQPPAERARALAAQWWTTVDYQDGRCDDCGRPIPRDGGFLTQGHAMLVGGLLLGAGDSPDLVCDGCFSPRTHEPFVGVVGCLCDACGQASVEGYCLRVMTGFRDGSARYERLLPADVWLCPGCLRSLARSRLQKDAREWALGIVIGFGLLLFGGIVAVLGGLVLAAVPIALIVGAVRQVRIYSHRTAPDVLFRIAFGNPAKPGAVDEMGVLAGIVGAKRPQCLWWTPGQLKALTDKGAVIQLA